MKEELLQYAWQYKQFVCEAIETTDGQPIEIIDCGVKNENAGPDFFNAKIKIGDTLWAGNVEIHQSSSDWRRHKHSEDKRYDSVILHVVEKFDCVIHRKSGEKIPQMEIRTKENVKENHDLLLASKDRIRCAPFWDRLSEDFIILYISRLLNERFVRKTNVILEHLLLCENNWEEVFYVSLARNFGMNVNALPFEMLAKSLPLNAIYKHRNSLVQIEAMLFGQAGLLNEEVADDYYKKLQTEYFFLANKFSLHAIEPSLWKFAKMHPSNFPQIRIAQFASLIFHSHRLFSRLVEEDNLAKLRQLFHCSPSPYWETHYGFGKTSPKRIKTLGEKSIDILLINTVIPFLFAYSVKKDCPEIQDKAYRLMEEIAPEQNSIISNWKPFNIKIKSAYETQALLELKKKYCDEKKCLRCEIGHRLISKRTNE